jgi:hypothetical protein
MGRPLNALTLSDSLHDYRAKILDLSRFYPFFVRSIRSIRINNC